MLKSVRNMLLFLLIVVVLYVMHSLARIILPLVIALMFVMIYQPIFSLLNRKRIPSWIITPFLAITTILILTFVVQIVLGATQDVYADRHEIGELLYNKILQIMSYFDSIIPIKLDASLLEQGINRLFSGSSISAFAGSSFTVISSFGSSFFMFSLYFLILLFSMPGYERYLEYIAGSDTKFKNNAKHIQKSIVSYMTVKFLASLVTGTITLVVCLLFNVKYAVFWGFVTFLLNFIPTLGSIIATTLPALMAFIQFDSMIRLLVFVLILLSIQMAIGNFIEPRIMGNRLKVNTVTIIFGLVFWAFIWGIPGAFLSVPLLVIVKIFLQNNDSLHFMARVMGGPEPNINKDYEIKK